MVLAYHAVADLSEDHVIGPYSVAAAQLEAQLDHLLAAGRRFVDIQTALRGFTLGAPMPEGATLVTFDDGYAHLSEVVTSVLEPRGIPAVVFMVSGEIGGNNRWDRAKGATSLPLLAAGDLRDLWSRGVAIGSHGVTHRSLAKLRPRELEAELRDSAAQLAAIGLPRPVALAYPYGEWDRRVAAAAEAAGYLAAFTTTSGVARRGALLHALPRIEVHVTDTPHRLETKLRTARLPRWTRKLARGASLRRRPQALAGKVVW